jgi:predicted transcriptional regulator
MPRRKTPTLTEAELKVMDMVWKLGEATVNDVASAQRGPHPLAYNTILTTMRILEKKGYLRHEKNGRAHVYRPIVDRQQARSKAVRQMVKSFFDDSPGLLMMNLLKNEDLTSEERDRLKQMLDTNEKPESE